MLSNKKSTGSGVYRWAVYLPVILILVLSFSLVQRARAAITLISFTATGMNGYNLVEWETATEIDNLGFFVQASNQESGTYTRISDFTISTGDALTGATYSYIDNDVTPGVRKYYKLESVANDQSSELTGPVSAVPGQASTATSTVTPSSTSTGISNSTRTPTRTPTSTPGPTATTDSNTAYPLPTLPPPAYPYPAIGTTVPTVSIPTIAVPLATSTSIPIGSAYPDIVSTSPTQSQGLLFQEGTLVPLPSITIQFVEGTAITDELSIQANPELPKEGDESRSSGNWSRYGILAFIVLIWALLGGWFWFSFRKVE